MKMSLRKKSTEPIVRANDEQIKFLIDYMGRHKDFENDINEYTNINEYTDLEVALLDEEMNNEDNSEILDGNILKENNELNKSDYLNLKPSTSVNQTMDIPLQSSRRSNRDVPTMSNNSKKPKLDTYMDLVKGTNDGFIAIAASLDKLATAMQNSSELINHGLMNIADAISKHA